MASDNEENRANAVDDHFQMKQAHARRLDDAIAWHVRMDSSEANELVFTEFAAWLDNDPANRVAYDVVEDFNGVLGEEISRERKENSPQSSNGFGGRPYRSKRRSIAVWTFGISAIAAALLIFFLLDTNPPSAMKYATGVGQSRAVTLSDGSKIEMNTATTLSVQVSSRQRRVTLDRGEAVFRIRHERGRPFIVRAGDREVHDIGTVFDVLRNGEVIAIAVAEGQIAVAPAAGGEPITMRAGQRLRHTEGSSSSTLDTVDPQWVTTWQNGYLIYRDAPLRDVVADLNRYFRRPITLDERAASAEHFSGVLRIHDENTAVTQLTAFLPIIAIRQADGTIQLRSSKPKH